LYTSHLSSTGFTRKDRSIIEKESDKSVRLGIQTRPWKIASAMHGTDVSGIPTRIILN